MSAEKDGSSHMCPVCRCNFPAFGPQMKSSQIGKNSWMGMADNTQRLATELAELRRAVGDAKRDIGAAISDVRWSGHWRNGLSHALKLLEDHLKASRAA